MSQQNDIKAFNKYCAEVMGYKTFEHNANIPPYDPYSNLNQLAEVFDKLWFAQSRPIYPIGGNMTVNKIGIATAMREFIWSTHD